MQAASNNNSLVCACDEAETLVVQYDFLRLSFFADDFKDFVDTLVAAQRAIDKTESPVLHIHPVTLRESATSE